MRTFPKYEKHYSRRSRSEKYISKKKKKKKKRHTSSMASLGIHPFIHIDCLPVLGIEVIAVTTTGLSPSMGS
jgi:hypothetical protein